MILLDRNDLTDLVVEALSNGGLSGPAVVAAVHKHRPGITRQAVYAVLRKLLAQEAVHKVGKTYALNRMWLKKLHAFASERLSSLDKGDAAHVGDINDGDSITYRFKNPWLMDIYWDHIFDAVMETHDPTIPVVVYHPHEWFIHARPDTEQAFLRGFARRGEVVFFSIGGNTPLDKAFKREWGSDTMQVNCGQTYGFKPGYYLNVMGDLIFEVFIEKGFADDIDDIFMENAPDAPECLKEATQRQYRTKLVFSRDKKKADMLRKRLSKEFYMPVGVRG
ncbi:MAG: hypothetical protein HGA67_01600 [Candidatus Yonathbacteria bacterium]|nr:hypothetical protein [Candidatus Yonathbacteria bacterium]